MKLGFVGCQAHNVTAKYADRGRGGWGYRRVVWKAKGMKVGQINFILKHTWEGLAAVLCNTNKALLSHMCISLRCDGALLAACSCAEGLCLYPCLTMI